MSESRKNKQAPKKTKGSKRAAEIANTFEWLITAFILAFLFRAFIMEAFRIPTGSMADTLMGAHFRLRCPQCGYPYNYGFIPEKYGFRRDYIPHQPIKSLPSRCPSCGYFQPTGGSTPIAGGDRILVLKCIYQFFEPHRWDVVVFKNPLEPDINYIKRLIGLPGETVEIIDGDIYINGKISRKPPQVQDVLWMPVYNNDYRPVHPRRGTFNGHAWQMPLKNESGSHWQQSTDNPTQFTLNSPVNRINTLYYDSSIGNSFRAAYAYNDVRRYPSMPYCSDLCVRLYAKSGGSFGRVGVSLSKYDTLYKAWVNSDGQMVICSFSNGTKKELKRRTVPFNQLKKLRLLKFTSVDHRLILEFGDEKMVYDMGRNPQDAGNPDFQGRPSARIFGSGNLAISHIAIYKDIYYTSSKRGNGESDGRATEGRPFTLGKDEFFVLGDNSPNSEDGRWWDQPGKGNNGITYRAGVVPRDYLVGKALFVYWPSGFKPFKGFPIGIIPNVGKMRFIYGGSEQGP